jgi:myo-inositol 2-dehydrogenase / D-chiro-inositol 1-dehydrogenase
MSFDSPNPSRREFLKTSGLAAGALMGGLAMSGRAYAAGDETLKIGLVGCGGRGSGALKNALMADKSIKVTAMADLFPDKIDRSLSLVENELKEQAKEKVDVPAERRFAGFDAYQKLIDSGVDVVILATPTHFRPQHLKAVVAAKKHVFCEKPIAVDAPGVRSVMETVEEARKLGLSLVSGLCYRYDLAKRATFDRIFDGAIGDIINMQTSYLTSTLKYFPRQPEWSDMEYTLRNWQYFTWLSGDHNVEQHIHSLDKCAWAMHDESPVKCMGIGGRQMRPEGRGNVFDHFDVVYEYANGQKLFARCRQMDGCDPDVSDFIFGTKGTASIMQHTITGDNKWRYQVKRDAPPPDMYQQEHDELFASIRAGKPVNNGTYMCRSTMMAIMGRMSAYTGKQVTWEQALADEESFTLPKYDLSAAPPDAQVAKPGVTKLVGSNKSEKKPNA